MKTRCLIASAFAALVCASPATGQAPASSRMATVAVIDFESGGSFGRDAWDLSALGKAIGSTLARQLRTGAAVDVVEREQIRAVIEEHKLAIGGMTSERAMELGKLLGAQYLVFGTVTDVQSTMRIDARVVEVATGRIAATAVLDDERDDVFSIVDRVAAQLLDEASFPAPDSRARGAAFSGSARALIMMSEGLALEDRGETDRAAEVYRKVIELFPDYADARERLARIRE